MNLNSNNHNKIYSNNNTMQDFTKYKKYKKLTKRATILKGKIRKAIKNNQPIPDYIINLFVKSKIYYRPSTEKFVKRIKKNEGVFNKMFLKKMNFIKFPIQEHQEIIINEYENDDNAYLYLKIKPWFKSNYNELPKFFQITLIIQNDKQFIKEKLLKKEFIKTHFNKNWDQFREFIKSNDSDGLLYMSNNQKVTMIMSKMNNLKLKYYKQNFLNGVNHCFFHPIQSWAHQKLNTVKSQSSKKRYNAIINKCIKYKNVYKEGIPEDDIKKVCDDININVSIHNTISHIDNNKNLHKIYKSNKNPIKHFKYINSRSNHVDLLTCTNVNNIDIETAEEMETIMKNIRAEKRIVPYYKIDNKFYTIYDNGTVYNLVSEYKKSVDEFEEKNNLNFHRLLHGSDISNYIQNSVRVPNSININNNFANKKNKELFDGLEFGINSDSETDDELDEEDNYNNIKMIDMNKAFYNFKKCPHYDGFGLSPYALIYNEIPIEDAINNEAGFYQVDKLKYNNVDKNKIKLLKKFFENKDILTHAEIKFLYIHKVDFKIISGCYCIKGELEMTEKMKNKDVRGTPNYSVWFGSQLSINEYYKKEFDNFDKNIICDIKQQLNKNNIPSIVLEDELDKKITIKFKKNKIFHRAHIVSYIHAYCRLSLLEQAFKFDYKDIIKINTDAIYINNSYKYNLNNLVSSFEHDETRDGIKSKKFLSSSSGCVGYSKIWDHEINIIETKYFKNQNRILLNGAGGCGKTYSIFNNNSFNNICYLAHSNKLSRALKNEYNKKCVYAAPYQHLFTSSPKLEYYILKNNFIFIDEASFLSYDTIKALFKISRKYSKCLYFAGDITHQIQPVKDKTPALKRMKLFKNIITYKKNYRFKCDKHKKNMSRLRDMMTNNKSVDKILDFVKSKYSSINRRQFLRDVKLNDIVLSSRHCINDKFDNKLANKFNENKKFICSRTTNLYSRGDIITAKERPNFFNEKYCYTIHSYQGETIKEGQTLYIFLKDFNNKKVIYTALSRAQYKKQIKLIQ